MRNFLIEF